MSTFDAAKSGSFKIGGDIKAPSWLWGHAYHRGRAEGPRGRLSGR
jgi:hypothetical protein